MELKFTVSARISKPIAAVFEAVVDPEKLSSYFATGGAKGRLEAGATVIWDFHDFPGATPVEVLEIDENKKIVLRWAAYEGANDAKSGELAVPSDYKTTVTIVFEPLGADRTLVTITEEGWRETNSSLKGSYGNCEGWTQMLCSLRVWIEHGINLREGMYK
jgi:uncharacterized protein YndB with AHSA1/START domain